MLTLLEDFKSTMKIILNRSWLSGCALLVICVCINLIGCASNSIYVLDQAEVVRVQENQTVTAKFKGWLFSDQAVNRVMNAKIKRTNLE